MNLIILTAKDYNLPNNDITSLITTSDIIDNLEQIINYEKTESLQSWTTTNGSGGDIQ